MEGDPSLMPEATNREASEEAPDLCVKRLATAQGAAASFQVIAHRDFSFRVGLFCDASPHRPSFSLSTVEFQPILTRLLFNFDPTDSQS